MIHHSEIFFYRFCTDKQNNEVYALTMKIYPDIKTIETGLSGSFQALSLLFPGKNVPGSIYLYNRI